MVKGKSIWQNKFGSSVGEGATAAAEPGGRKRKRKSDQERPGKIRKRKEVDLDADLDQDFGAAIADQTVQEVEDDFEEDLKEAFQQDDARELQSQKETERKSTEQQPHERSARSLAQEAAQRSRQLELTEAAMIEAENRTAQAFEISYKKGDAVGAPDNRVDEREKELSKTLLYLRHNLRDFTALKNKPDHAKRPLWIDPERATIILEKFHPLAAQATDFLITVAEPRCRPTHLHEYALTMHSLYAAVAVGMQSDDIIKTLDSLLKIEIPQSIVDFITSSTQSYGKVKLVLKHNRYLIECADVTISQELANDSVIRAVRCGVVTSKVSKSQSAVVIAGTNDAAGLKQAGLTNRPRQETDGMDPEIYAALMDGEDNEDELGKSVYSFEVLTDDVETVKKRCLDLSYPILEEYDFRNDDANASLEIDLRPMAQIRPYQEKCLSKMFGNGRAQSGIIVLPCGAGKTLVGITAACTIKKGAVILCTSTVSAVQWREEFLKWTNINPEDITTFTADSKTEFPGATGIIVTTYSMVTCGRQRSEQSQKMMEFLHNREWGLMILDEVHVAPADLFRRVISTIKSHAKLGLTATLLREDDKISHLNFLIGPKLYEANWMELSEQGHIAKVQCAEVWCDMPWDYCEQYLKQTARIQRTLGAVNPNKFQACQYLINYHESRGDKIIVFSDELYALKLYALKMGKAFIYGDTGQQERLDVLANFQYSDKINTIFLSKIGDTSLDLPEATVLIQISSHFGSRRQEAQRLGRILRAKRRNDEGFNAFFYTLVSRDTQEMLYSWNRQKFLVAQGYAFKIITQLLNQSAMPGLGFVTQAERRALLRRSLKENDSAYIFGGFERDQTRKRPAQGKKASGGKRVAAQLNDVGQGREMGAHATADESEEPAKKRRKKNVQGQNPFFKKLARERENRRKKAGE